MSRATRGDTASFTLDDDPAPLVAIPAVSLDRLARHLAALRLHGRTTVAMVARLDGYLDRLDAIPVEDWCRWQEGSARWITLRCGPLTRPPPPHLWPWPEALAGWVTRGYPLAVRCREAYLRLDRGGQHAAQSRWGPLRGSEGGQDFRNLWRYGTPVDRMEVLDRRAEQLRVRVTTVVGRESA